jgi:hypothetical protein
MRGLDAFLGGGGGRGNTTSQPLETFFFFLKEGWDRFVRGKGKLLGKYIDGKGVGFVGRYEVRRTSLFFF